MHHTLTQGFNDVCLDLSNPGRNRVSGEMSIAPAAPKNHCQSRAKGPPSFRAALRAVDRKIVGHYKYFGPVALCFIATLLIANLSILSITARAQRKSAAPATAQVPSPRSVFGFNPGDERTIVDWKQITDYFARLDRASDRVQVQTIGQSTLGVPLIAAFISAPENIRNLEKYKAIQARLADPRKAMTDADRDWFMLDLKETKTVTRLLWKEWFPEIVYDIHQQGSNGSRFFVPPFYDPPNPHIAPLLLRQVGLIGHKMAADVTAAGFKGILTNALYDTWWHGGFRTAPYYHNSIGILTEAASARIMTPGNVTREQLVRGGTRGMRSALEATTNFPEPWPGGSWRPRDIFQMEMIACHSVLSLAANYREDYLRNFYELGNAGLAKIEEDAPIAYTVPPGQGRDENVAKMIGTLIDQGVEVYRL